MVLDTINSIAHPVTGTAPKPSSYLLDLVINMKRLATWLCGRWQRLKRSFNRRSDSDSDGDFQPSDKAAKAGSFYAKEAVARRKKQRRFAVCLLANNWCLAILKQPVVEGDWETAEIFTSNNNWPFYNHGKPGKYTKSRERERLVAHMRRRCRAVLLVGWVEDGNVLADLLRAAKHGHGQTATDEWIAHCLNLVVERSPGSPGWDAGVSKMTNLRWLDLKHIAETARHRGEVIECH